MLLLNEMVLCGGVLTVSNLRGEREREGQVDIYLASIVQFFDLSLPLLSSKRKVLFFVLVKFWNFFLIEDYQYRSDKDQFS